MYNEDTCIDRLLLVSARKSHLVVAGYLMLKYSQFSMESRNRLLTMVAAQHLMLNYQCKSRTDCSLRFKQLLTSCYGAAAVPGGVESTLPSG